jgi:ABC-type multidrug transport system ATPase subunit
VIRFEGASKSYVSLLRRRRVDALVDFSLELVPGEVVGIAGPNGAGKSTLISLLLGFLQPTTGRIEVGGLAPRQYVERHGVGYLTELVNLPPNLKVPAVLDRLAILAGLPRETRGPAVREAMDRLGLGEHAAKKVKQLSKGNLQRVGLGQALLGDFDLVVLDEPTHGLDPVWTQRFRDIVTALRRPGRVILIASHNLEELEQLADRVAILDHGRLARVVGHGTDASAAAIAWRLIFEGEPEVVTALAAAVPVEGRPGTWRVLASRAEMSRGLAELLGGGAVLVECVPEQGRLAAAFHETVQR